MKIKGKDEMVPCSPAKHLLLSGLFNNKRSSSSAPIRLAILLREELWPVNN
jgi:hypothetical protein